MGLGNDNPQQVRGDKIHENELLSDTVELALTYRDCIERGSGECVISSKWDNVRRMIKSFSLNMVELALRLFTTEYLLVSKR